MNGKEKDLWRVLGFDILVAVFCLIAIAFNWSLANNTAMMVLAGLFSIVLILFHALWTLGVDRGLSFLFLSAAVGFIFEALGTQTGMVFGRYIYLNQTATVAGVPLLIILYWAVFIYIGYSITTSFFYWSGRKKPNYIKHDWPLLLSSIIIDGLIVVAIDLFMDPLQVRLGTWRWVEKGGYFGIPLQNFVGWFLVTIVATGIFRIYEYYYPYKPRKVSKGVYLIPLLCYIVMGFIFVVLSLIFGMPQLIMQGSLLMLLVAVVNLLMYEKRLVHRHFKQLIKI